jgi:hypothetical protein
MLSHNFASPPQFYFVVLFSEHSFLYSPRRDGRSRLPKSRFTKCVVRLPLLAVRHLILRPEASSLKASRAMARGWESKSVEYQMESSQSGPGAPSKRQLTPEMAEVVRKKESLLLARTHLLQQLQAAQNPRHREMMERALSDLEKLLGNSAARAKSA